MYFQSKIRNNEIMKSKIVFMFDHLYKHFETN